MAPDIANRIPTREERLIRSPKNTKPAHTAQAGMVYPRMAARPDDNIFTPIIISECHISMLGIASLMMVRDSPLGIVSETPCTRATSQMTARPPTILSTRKVSGGNSRTPIFMTGQFRPQNSVKSASSTRSLRLRCLMGRDNSMTGYNIGDSLATNFSIRLS